MRRRQAMAVSLTLWLAATGAGTAELAGVRLPDAVEVEGKTLVLNGLGLREATFLKVDVYVAGLYLQEKSSDPRAILDSDQTKRLVMHFVRSVKAKAIREAWEEGVAANADGSLEPFRERLDRLNRWMENVEPGDEIVLTFVHGRGVHVSVRGQDKGWIEGDDFARVLLAIWLGPNPPNAGLKEGLLGQR